MTTTFNFEITAMDRGYSKPRIITNLGGFVSKWCNKLTPSFSIEDISFNLESEQRFYIRLDLYESQI
jgi:hypothetical protein